MHKGKYHKVQVSATGSSIGLCFSLPDHTLLSRGNEESEFSYYYFYTFLNTFPNHILYFHSLGVILYVSFSKWHLS